MIAGFISPTGGEILFDGKNVTALPPHRREVGLVFQSYALFPHMTVSENVAFGLKMRGRPRSEIRERVTEALNLVKLEAFSDRFPKTLSGGEQQRVALARALVIKPKLLLLDEPFGALDRQLRDHMRVELKSLQKSLEVPTVFVTHDQGEALSMSDRIAVMNGGRLEQLATPTDLYERPASAFVAQFLGRSNVLKFDVIGYEGDATWITCGGLRFRMAGRCAGPSVTAMVRPERILLRRPEATDPPERIGLVRVVSYLGSSVEIVAAFGGVAIEVLTFKTGASDFEPREGDRVVAEIREDAIWPLALGQ
jgi:ABC-type Fe3+/spermidine/putrescine transport system ATPase subunit